MKLTAQEYARRVQRAGPHSPLGTDCLWAFGVGGGICLLGEVLRQWYLGLGLEADLAGTLTSCTLIALSAVLTTLGLYQKLAARPSRALPTPWSARPSSSRPRAACWAPGPRCSPSPGRSSCTAHWLRCCTAGCSGCWAADPSHLPYALPGAKIARSRRFSSIPQNPQKNIPERRNFSWRPGAATP